MGGAQANERAEDEELRGELHCAERVRGEYKMGGGSGALYRPPGVCPGGRGGVPWCCSRGRGGVNPRRGQLVRGVDGRSVHC